jgi:hypothetical protein
MKKNIGDKKTFKRVELSILSTILGIRTVKEDKLKRMVVLEPTR